MFAFAGRYIQRCSAIVPWLRCFLPGTQPSTPKKLHKSIPFMKGRFWKWKSELELLRIVIGENTDQKSVAQHCVSRMSWRKRDTFWLKFGGKWPYPPWNCRFSCGWMGGSTFFPLDDPRLKFHRGRLRPPHSRPRARPRVFVVDAIPRPTAAGERHGNWGSQRGRVQITWKLISFSWKTMEDDDPFLVKWPLFSGPSLAFGRVFCKGMKLGWGMLGWMRQIIPNLYNGDSTGM